MLRLPVLYLPPVAWYVALIASDKVCLDTDSPYRKQSYRNRCYIMSANGPLPLIIPVASRGLKQAMSQVETDPDRSWKRLHWRAIETAYNRSPFFLYYRDRLEERYTDKTAMKLLDWNRVLIDDTLDILGVSRFRFTDTGNECMAGHPVKDLREAFHPKDRNAPGTRMQFQPYRQVFAEKWGFVPNLSILDLLFNLGPEALEYIDHTLVNE